MDSQLSRSEKKRRAKGVEQLVYELAALPANDIDSLPCDTDVRDEIFSAKKLKGGAKKRQLKYVTKLLRDRPVDDLYDFLAKKKGSALKQQREFKEIEYRGADSQRPRFRKFSVNVSIPGTLSRLRDLAYNLWWTWNPQAQELFALLTPGLYTRLRHNPVAFLEAIAPERLDEAARDEKYREAYKSITAEFDAYIKEAKCLVAGGQEAFENHPVAYFSMEYGFHECLPIYSGGLGILSGDHIKSASDLGINLVAIGLLYKNGYFKQGISRDGDQLVEYYVNDFFRMPLQELHQAHRGEK